MFIFSAFVFVGCNSEEECEHKFNHYVVLAPTCTQKGILESLCEKCGEKQYSDLTPSGHDFVNGVCSICSQTNEEPATTPSPLNKEIGWTIEKIYERFHKIFDHTKLDFIDMLQSSNLSDLYITKNGNLHMSVSYKFDNYQTVSIILPNVRENFEFERKENFIEPIVFGIDPFLNYAIYETQQFGEFAVVTSDGTMKYYGRIGIFIPEDNTEKYLERLIINMKNELYLVYNDDSVKFVGIIPTEEESYPENENEFIYLQSGTNYYVYGATNKDASSLTIPISHRGKTLSTIISRAFADCKKLQSVIIPSNITRIEFKAFPNGTKIFTDHTSIPKGWSESVVASCLVYLQGEWDLINGVPTPKN